MHRIPTALDTSGAASTSTFLKVQSAFSISFDIATKMGPMRWQGGHQVAVKSTIMGLSLVAVSATSALNSSKL